jgi:hypothetical protein
MAHTTIIHHQKLSRSKEIEIHFSLQPIKGEVRLAARDSVVACCCPKSGKRNP